MTGPVEQSVTALDAQAWGLTSAAGEDAELGVIVGLVAIEKNRPLSRSGFKYFENVDVFVSVI